MSAFDRQRHFIAHGDKEPGMSFYGVGGGGGGNSLMNLQSPCQDPEKL